MNIFEIFEKASKTLQYPRLTYRIDDNTKIVFYPSKAVQTKDLIGTINIGDGNHTWYGRIFPTDTGAKIKWNEKIADIPRSFKDLCIMIVKDPVSSCKLQGQQIGWCCFCGLQLTNKHSVSVGYGPICAEKWGLPWGQVELTDASNL